MAAELAYAARLVHFGQIGACVHGGYCSYGAITRLRKYETVAKQAANYSQEAERQLSLTWKSHTAGVLCLLLSLTTTMILIAIPDYITGWLQWIPSPTTLLVTVAMRLYIQDYWTPYKDSDGSAVGTRVPLPYMEEYNEAELKTEELLKVLQYLEWSWALSSLFTAIGLGV